jgi:hypothetical protein
MGRHVMGSQRFFQVIGIAANQALEWLNKGYLWTPDIVGAYGAFIR